MLKNYINIKNFQTKLLLLKTKAPSFRTIDRFEKKNLEPSLPALLDFPAYTYLFQFDLSERVEKDGQQRTTLLRNCNCEKFLSNLFQ